MHADEDELIIPQTVETGDSIKMKQVMDDAVIKAVSSLLLSYHAVVDFVVDLLLMLVLVLLRLLLLACCFAG